jgi:hypothetical protein
MSDIPTSGAISLNQMHTEVDGASGSIVSINDADIRALIGKGSGVTMSFNEWYGASAQVDSFNIVVGRRTVSGYLPEAWGYISGSNGTGSIASGSNATAEFCSGTYTAASWITFYNGTVAIEAAGTTNSNSGFTTATFNGTSFTRSSANYSFNNSTNARVWEWRGQSNPFSDGSQGGYQGIGDTVEILLT